MITLLPRGPAGLQDRFVLGICSGIVERGRPFYVVVGLYGSPPGYPHMDFGRLDGKRSEYAVRLAGRIIPCQNVLTLSVRSNDTLETFIATVAEFNSPADLPAGTYRLEICSVASDHSKEPYIKIGDLHLTLSDPPPGLVQERGVIQTPSQTQALGGPPNCS